MIAHKTLKKPFWRGKALHMLAWMVIAALLLSACSNLPAGNSPGSSSTPGQNTSSAPAISPTLQNEGATQLQTFQQWIELMQQNGGSVTTYQQQYTSDQQALANASTTA